MVHHALKQGVKLDRIKRNVHIAPVHQVSSNGVFHRELVLGRAAGIFAGIGDQGSVAGQRAFTKTHGMFDQSAVMKIAVYLVGF